MPRQARLDAPGLLQHVMARGIERREIFKDDKDRSSFLDRLAVILDETQTQCYAWSLIPNHFHLLLRTTLTPLPTVMRRLMTGHAVTFNKRHRRAGHLFQNRYKSIVCEEDNYLLELTRYIHLNPLRARLVKDLKELDIYPWSGHSTILGKTENPLAQKKNREVVSTGELDSGSTVEDPVFSGINPACPASPVKYTAVSSEADLSGIAPEDGTRIKNDKLLAEETVEDVLLYFGEKTEDARKKYRQFVKDGIEKGRRPELQGGGLIRSQGGDKSMLLGLGPEDREDSDQRILGSGDFVATIIHQSEEERSKKRTEVISLKNLTLKVSENVEIAPIAVLSPSRERKVSNARAIISYLGVREAGYSQTELAKHLNISRVAVRNSISRAERMLDTCMEIWDKVDYVS